MGVFFWRYAMISMVTKICKCHEVPEDKCHFIRTLRDLRADRFADEMVEEREVPSMPS
jgi:hypothetical protein